MTPLKFIVAGKPMGKWEDFVAGAVDGGEL